MRSRHPPWPGNSTPESFRLAARFTNDSKRSPITADHVSAAPSVLATVAAVVARARHALRAKRLAHGAIALPRAAFLDAFRHEREVPNGLATLIDARESEGAPEGARFAAAELLK